MQLGFGRLGDCGRLPGVLLAVVVLSVGAAACSSSSKEAAPSTSAGGSGAAAALDGNITVYSGQHEQTVEQIGVGVREGVGHQGHGALR